MEKSKTNILSLLASKCAKVNRTSKIAIGITLAFALLMTGLSAYNNVDYAEIKASLIAMGDLEIDPSAIDKARKPGTPGLPGQTSQPTEHGTTGTVVDNKPSVVGGNSSSGNGAVEANITPPFKPQVQGSIPGEGVPGGTTPSENSPKYDLYVAPKSVTIAPDDLKVSDRVQLKSKVKNMGPNDITTPFNVVVTLKYVNTGSKTTTNIPFKKLSAGAEFPIQVSLPAVQIGGVYEFTVTADPENKIAETNENNNSDTFQTAIPRIADVNVISVNSDPNQVKQGEDFKIKTTISNTGSKDYTNDLTIWFQVKDKSEKIVKKGGLKRGETINEEAKFTAGSDSSWVGGNEVKVFVNSTSDADSGNNSGKSTINILSEILTCTDSDEKEGIFKPNRKGTVTITNREGKKIAEKTDYCKDTRSVIEYSCLNGDIPGTETECHKNETCSDGACVETVTCSETDANDPLSKGTATLKDYTGKVLETQTDSCDANGRTIIEYACGADKNTGKSKIFKDTSSSCTLDQKCVDGACVDKTESDIPGDYKCTDMHKSGVDYKYAKGIINLFKGQKLLQSVADRCYVSPGGTHYKVQFGCYNNESGKVSKIIPCEGKCSDGACIKAQYSWEKDEAVKALLSQADKFKKEYDQLDQSILKTKNARECSAQLQRTAELISELIDVYKKLRDHLQGRKNAGISGLDAKISEFNREFDRYTHYENDLDRNYCNTKSYPSTGEAKPDLAIKHIAWNGDNSKIEAVVLNISKTPIPAGSTVQIVFATKSKEVPVTQKLTKPLTITDFIRFEVSTEKLGVEPGSEFKVNATVDPGNAIEESNEQNNGNESGTLKAPKKAERLGNTGSTSTQAPDLAIKHVAWSSNSESKAIEAVVLNISKTAIPAGSTVQIVFATKSKEVPVTQKLTKALTITDWITFEVSPEKLGVEPNTEFVVKATIDPGNAIEESNEQNNENESGPLSYSTEPKNTGGIVISPIAEASPTPEATVNPNIPTGNPAQLWKTEPEIRIAKKNLLDAVLLMAQFADQRGGADQFDPCIQATENELEAWSKVGAAAEKLLAIAKQIGYEAKIAQLTRYIESIPARMEAVKNYCSTKFGQQSGASGNTNTVPGATEAQQEQIAKLNARINELAGGLDNLIGDAEAQTSAEECNGYLTSGDTYQELIKDLDALSKLYTTLKQEASAAEVDAFIAETKKKYSDALKMCEEKKQDPKTTDQIKKLIEEVNTRIPEVEQFYNQATASSTTAVECKAILDNNTIFKELEGFLSALAAQYANAGMEKESKEASDYLNSIVAEWDAALKKCDSKSNATETTEQQSEQVSTEIQNEGDLEKYIAQLKAEIERAKAEGLSSAIINSLEEQLAEAERTLKETQKAIEQTAAEKAEIEKKKKAAAEALKAAEAAKKAAEEAKKKATTDAQKAAADAAAKKAQDDALKKQLEAQNKLLEQLQKRLAALSKRKETAADVICRLSPDSEACKRARGEVKDVEVRIVRVAATQKEVAAKTAKQVATTPAQKQEAEKQLKAVQATRAAVERSSSVGELSKETIDKVMKKDFPKHVGQWYDTELVFMRLANCVKPGDFQPGKFITRAEAAKILSCIRLGKDYEKKLTEKSFKTLFNDTSEAQWFYAPTMYLYGEGIIQGYQSKVGPHYRDSRPSSHGNRAEILALLLKAYGLNQPIGNCITPFKDVPQTEWYSCNIKKASDMGMLTGYPDGTFKPGNKINRAEFIKLLKSLDDRAAKLTK